MSFPLYGLPHKPRWGDFTEHVPNENWAVDTLRDSPVPDTEYDAQFFARGSQIRHDCLSQFRRRAVLGKKHHDKEPEWARSQDGNMVHLGVNRVIPDVGCSSGICDGLRNSGTSMSRLGCVES